MSVNYSTVVANARLDVVKTALNASGGGDVILKTSGAAALCTVPLETVIGAPVNKVLTIISTSKQGTANAAGTAALADLVDGAGTVVASGLTVGTSAADIILNDLAIANGSLVTINSGTITHP
jgi:hypothetical protein